MEHADLTSRLRRLGTPPVPAHIQLRHRALLQETPRAARVPRRVLTAAAVAVAVSAGAAWAASHTGAATIDVVPAQIGDDGPAGFDPFPDDPCKGPPPFAGQVPEGATEEEREANRAAEAEAWEEFKAANCPDEDPGDPPGDNGGDGGPPSSLPVPPGAGAVIPADPATPADPDAAATTPAPAAEPGPPPGVPTGPPAGTPNGPPPGTPSGPPEGAGPPAGVPAGPPSGVADGDSEGDG